MIKKTYLRRNNQFIVLVNDKRSIAKNKMYTESYIFRGCTVEEDSMNFNSKEEGNDFYFKMIEEGFVKISEDEFLEVKNKFDILSY